MFRFSIIAVTILLVLAGMKITIASHYCNGSLAKTIISVNGKSASCGMEHAESIGDETIISSQCCDDELSVYDISNDYTPSDIRYSQIFHGFDYLFPTKIIPVSLLSVLPKQATSSPPGFYLISAVSAAEICVFRI